MREAGLNLFQTVQSLTVGQWKDLISAILGAVGTGFLFFGSYAYEPLSGAPFGGPILDAHNKKVRARNELRKRRQWFGLCPLCLSFVAQIVGVFLPDSGSDRS
jgi:hypothetical protein